MLRRFALRSAALALGASLMVAASAIADIRGPIPPRWRGRSGGGAREEWQLSRLMLGAGVGWPTTFPADWRPGPGWAIGLILPVARWCDVALDVEEYQHRFDGDDLRGAGATFEPPRLAYFSDFGVGVRLHSTEPGWRPFGLVAAMLPSVSRPTVFYTDASGTHEVAGTEQFAFDPGFVAGAGFEYAWPRRIGGALEGRLVVAPGRTRPTEVLAALRAALTVPLPR